MKFNCKCGCHPAVEKCDDCCSKVEYCIWCRQETPCECAMAMVRNMDDRVSSLEATVKKNWEWEYAQDKSFGERLMKLEAYIKMEDRVTASDVLLRLHTLETSVDFEKAKDLIYQGAQTHASILKLDARVKEIERFQDVTHAQHRLFVSRKVPHACPICDGQGSPSIQSDRCLEAPRKHYLETNPCHGCDGKGIVWG